MPTVGIDLAHLDRKIRHVIGYQGNQGNQVNQGEIMPEGETSPAANFGLESPPQSLPQSPSILPSAPKTLAQFLSNLHRDIESNVIGVGMLGYLPLEYVWNIGDRLGTALRKGGIQAAKVESDNIAKELVQAGIKIPSQAIKMGKAVIGETKQTITHPIQSFYDRPLSTTLTAANIAGLAALAKEPMFIAAKGLVDTGKLSRQEAIRLLQSQRGFARYNADDLDRLFEEINSLTSERQPTVKISIPSPSMSPSILSHLQTTAQSIGIVPETIFRIATRTAQRTNAPITRAGFLSQLATESRRTLTPEQKQVLGTIYDQIQGLSPEARNDLAGQVGLHSIRSTQTIGEPRYAIDVEPQGTSPDYISPVLQETLSRSLSLNRDILMRRIGEASSANNALELLEREIGRHINFAEQGRVASLWQRIHSTESRPGVSGISNVANPVSRTQRDVASRLAENVIDYSQIGPNDTIVDLPASSMIQMTIAGFLITDPNPAIAATNILDYLQRHINNRNIPAIRLPPREVLESAWHQVHR